MRVNDRRRFYANFSPLATPHGGQGEALRTLIPDVIIGEAEGREARVALQSQGEALRVVMVVEEEVDVCDGIACQTCQSILELFAHGKFVTNDQRGAQRKIWNPNGYGKGLPL